MGKELTWGGAAESFGLGALTGWIPTKMIGFGKGAKWGSGGNHHLSRMLDGMSSHGRSIWLSLYAAKLADLLRDSLLAKDIHLDIVGSFDPNDKTGTAGAGDAHYVLPGALMPFSIYYENDPEFASAAAQIVRVEDQLDAGFDWSTFELGDINLFGDFVVSVPAGLSYYETTVDLRPEGMDLLVHITAGIDGDTGAVEWLFESLDPDTLEAPDDAFAGFLAVNDKDLHNGEGHFQYFVRARDDLTTGTEIVNQAFNYFDQNEAVPTPTTFHTIDAGAPISSINALAAQVPDEPLLVSWSGQDDENGSGIETYTIYVSTDGGPWEVWLEDTADIWAEFAGIGGHGYAFRSVATDYVGHEEDDPGVAEASTTMDLHAAPRRSAGNDIQWLCGPLQAGA